MATLRLAARTSPEVLDRPVLIVPCGSTEQHGPHLPLDTDTVIARAVADRVAGRLDATMPGRRAVCAPAVEFGASGEHEGFAGTVSIGTEALTCLLLELVRSATRWCGPVLLISGHGGNADALAAASRRLQYENRPTVWTTCGEPEFDAHAGWAETSMMLALAPASVRRDRLEPGATESLNELLPRMRVGGVAAVSTNGILGDPRGADAETGSRMVERVVDRITEQWRRGEQDENGMLRRRATRTSTTAPATTAGAPA